jgi:L-threonylcarbamoyladenylate synthase
MEKRYEQSDLQAALKVLREGGVILYPTDTVWGIGCDPTNEQAVQKIYDLKRRADSKAMLLLTDSMAKVQAYVTDVPDVVWDLVECAEKPLTVIYPQGRNLATNLMAQDGSVGIRITNEAFSKQLCMRFKKPIVSTSANVSGQPTPAFFDEISEEIKAGVDYIVQAKQDDREKKQPSSIIKFEKNGTFAIIRE